MRQQVQIASAVLAGCLAGCALIHATPLRQASGAANVATVLDGPS